MNSVALLCVSLWSVPLLITASKNMTGAGHYRPPYGRPPPPPYPPRGYPPPHYPGPAPYPRPPPPPIVRVPHDNYYCSVFASYSLVVTPPCHPPKCHRPPPPNTGDGPPESYEELDASDGPNVGGYGPRRPMVRPRETRQYCRYTAATGSGACDTCCKIAARHFSTTVDEVQGIMLGFDPYKPPVCCQRGPGPFDTGDSFRKKRSPHTTWKSGSYESHGPPPTKEPEEEVKPIAQCLCCAPKKCTGCY